MLVSTLLGMVGKNGHRCGAPWLLPASSLGDEL
jgi:hypothetical protein